MTAHRHVLHWKCGIDAIRLPTLANTLASYGSWLAILDSQQSFYPHVPRDSKGSPPTPPTSPTGPPSTNLVLL